jgi:protein subunit release factor A
VIDRDDVEIEVGWSDDRSDPYRAAIRLTHKETGLMAESRKQATQNANFDTAMAELERKVAAAQERRPLLSRIGAAFRRFANRS